MISRLCSGRSPYVPGASTRANLATTFWLIAMRVHLD
jgi:hypothetical protein